MPDAQTATWEKVLAEHTRKVLYLSNSHPLLHFGGPATYVLDLHEAMAKSADHEPVLVSRIGSEPGVPRTRRPGAPFRSLEGDASQYLVLIEHDEFDFFYTTCMDKSLYTRHFADFLRAQQPDVVHFQPSLFMGCELISLIRRLLPAAPIVYTLHDYRPICHRDGMLVRTRGEAFCMQASPSRCHECFPEISEQDFFLRDRFIRAHLDHVDLFLAPSRFLLERYVDWGIPRAKIQLEEYGRPPGMPFPDSRADGPRNRLGFLGDLGPLKGVEILLRAMRILREQQVDAQLLVYGSNLADHPEDYQQRFWTLLQEAGNAGFAGSYDRAALPNVMSKVDWVVMPSRWWEASPLVIQEAFLYGHPVICSDIGVMAEKVTHEVNGLHFNVGNAHSLANTIRRAVTEPHLWHELRQGAPPVHTMDEHVRTLTGIYGELLERRSATEAPVALP